MMAVKREPLPRPDVNVSTNSTGGTDVVISRDGKAKSYTSDAASKDEIVKDVVKKILDDPRTAEWLP